VLPILLRRANDIFHLGGYQSDDDLMLPEKINDDYSTQDDTDVDTINDEYYSKARP